MSSQSAAPLSFRWARAFPRDLHLFVAGQTISQIGDQCLLVALSWLVAERTGSPAALGTILAVAAIPRALLMPFGGALADRVGHRRLLLIVGVALALLAVLAAGLAAIDVGALWVLAAVAVMFGIMEGIATPAAFSMVPQLVAPPMLASANSLLLGGLVLSGLVGPALAGFLLLHGGATLVFAFDSLSYVAAVGTLLLMAPMAKSSYQLERPTLLADLRVTLQAAWADRQLALYLILMLLGNLAVAGPLQVGLVALTRTTLGAGPQVLGTALAVLAGGSLAGTCLAAALARRAGSRRVLFGTILGSSVLLAAVGGVGTLAHLLAIIGMFGVGMGLLDVFIQTGVQQRAKVSQLGRVTGLALCAAKLLVPVSTLTAGLLAEYSVSGLFIVAGALWAGTTLMVLWGLGHSSSQVQGRRHESRSAQADHTSG
jgi:Na+/melibiose symporter-like transporter